MGYPHWKGNSLSHYLDYFNFFVTSKESDLILEYLNFLLDLHYLKNYKSCRIGGHTVGKVITQAIAWSSLNSGHKQNKSDLIYKSFFFFSISISQKLYNIQLWYTHRWKNN